MYRILASDGIETAAAAALEQAGFEVVQQFYAPEELLQKVKEFDVLVVRSATKVRAPIIDAASEGGRLKLIIRGGVGPRLYAARFSLFIVLSILLFAWCIL